MTTTTQKPTDGTYLIQLDPWLEPHADSLRQRYSYYRYALEKMEHTQSGAAPPFTPAPKDKPLLGPISQGHHFFGLNRGTDAAGKPGVWYREWAPGAIKLNLIGDFNQWDRGATQTTKDPFGTFSIFLNDQQYGDRLTHGSRVKVHVLPTNGAPLDRIPAYIRRVVQEPNSPNFTGQYWNPPAFVWKHSPPTQQRGGLRIYEAHLGMAQEAEKVGTYNEFTQNILPRINSLGYNCIQMMAIMEHPYYGSFGYHVSSFFAPSSRFGTPEELKNLIDTAHSMGILIIMDLVHSHAVKNVNEGLNKFDGTDYQYFHSGARGMHPGWDSLLFDYSKFEVQRFLLSNVRYWLEEFRFDGYRFDGVTSMLYNDHGLGSGFSSYDDYFSGNVDRDAVCYLQLANTLIHDVNPHAISIAEDVSGMVGLARPVQEGGLGFDYRLAMGVPDYWIKTLKEKTDEQWNLNQLFQMLMNRRAHEKHIGYAESHDQALVGDKTLAFWLMDKEMYWHMSKRQPRTLIIDRGLALHKMIRLITFSLAGEGYLNFMGNEFGHPEWVDFPRQGNNFSYKHARRQWSLVDSNELYYQGLNNFDRAMNQLDKDFNLLTDPFIEQLLCHEDTKQLVYRRGPLVFVFNFHPNDSYADLRIPVPDPKNYKVVLNTDAPEFDGHSRVAAGTGYPRQNVPMYGRNQSIQLYLPSRTAQVLAPV